MLHRLGHRNRLNRWTIRDARVSTSRLTVYSPLRIAGPRVAYSHFEQPSCPDAESSLLLIQQSAAVPSNALSQAGSLVAQVELERGQMIPELDERSLRGELVHLSMYEGAIP